MLYYFPIFLEIKGLQIKLIEMNISVFKKIGHYFFLGTKVFLSLALFTPIPNKDTATKASFFLSPLTQTKKGFHLYTFSRERGQSVSHVTAHKKIYQSLEHALTIEKYETVHVHKAISILRDLKLIPLLSRDKTLIDAGWNHIDWDQFATDFLEALDRVRLNIRDTELTISFHNYGSSYVLNGPFEREGNLAPIWGKTEQHENQKIIHLTEAFLATHWFSPIEEDRQFLMEVLFYYAMEKEVEELLRKNHDVAVETLTAPILRFLSPLANKWFYSSNTPPDINLIDKRSLLYASHKSWNDYLETLSPFNSLDFNQRLYSLKEEYSLALSCFEQLYPNQVRLQTALDDFRKELDILSQFDFYFALLEGEPLPQRIKELITLKEEFLPLNVDKKKVIEILIAKWGVLIENQAENISSHQLALVFGDDSSLSRGYRLKKEGEPSLFVKVPKKAYQAHFLGLEHKILTHILNDPHRPPYFIDSMKGLQIVKIDNFPHVALVMDYVENSMTLDQFVKKEIEKYNKTQGEEEREEELKQQILKLPTEQALSIIDQLLEAFTYLKKQKILVRDIKPSNILVLEDPLTREISIKIIDFSSHFEGEDPFQATQKVGTPFFWSPQEIVDQPYTYSDDLYKLGVVFYYILSGDKFPYKSPNVQHSELEYEGQSPRTIAQHIAKNALNELNMKSEDLRIHRLAKIINKMIQKSPSKRYKHIEKVKIAFSHIYERSPSASKKAPSTPRTEISL